MSRREATTSARRQCGGFTLIEVLVTLVIVASAAAIVLAHLRTLLDLQRNAREQQAAVSDTLNRVSLLPTIDLKNLVVKQTQGRLQVRARGARDPFAEIENLPPPRGEPVPVDKAYTPYQVFRLAPDSRYSVSLIQRGLPPPRQPDAR